MLRRFGSRYVFSKNDLSIFVTLAHLRLCRAAIVVRFSFSPVTQRPSDIAV